MEIQSCGPFVAKIDDEIVGFAAAMDFGPFAYIGKMGVDPRFQHRGVGGRILATILKWLEDRKCPRALLDASPYGGPLDQKFGFIESDLTAVMQQQNEGKNHKIIGKNAPNLVKAEVVEFPKLLSFDKPRFGQIVYSFFARILTTDPIRFLVSYDQKGQVDGFLVAQSRVIGPWSRVMSRLLKVYWMKLWNFPLRTIRPYSSRRRTKRLSGSCCAMDSRNKEHYVTCIKASQFSETARVRSYGQAEFKLRLESYTSLPTCRT